MRRFIKWYVDNADDVVDAFASISALALAAFFAGVCVIGCIKLWALIW